MAKKIFAAKRVSKLTRLCWIIFPSVIAIAFAGVGYFFYQQKTHSLSSLAIDHYFSNVKMWLAARQTHLHQHIAKVKKLARPENVPAPEAHFEFYTALPNMQVNLPAPATNAVKLSPKKNLVREAKENTKRDMRAAKSPALPTNAFDPEDIERDLARHVAKTTAKNDID